MVQYKINSQSNKSQTATGHSKKRNKRKKNTFMGESYISDGI